MSLRVLLAAVVAAGTVPTTPAWSGEAHVTAARADRTGGTWRFVVTVSHGDIGWDHYADAWRIVGPDGTVYGTRTLFHPHVDEQPFTRSLAGVVVPAGVRVVIVESHDSVHGWGGDTISLQLDN